MPFAVETAGVVSPAAAELVKELGRRLIARTGDRRATAWLYQRVSVAVARGNAASVLATAKSSATGPRPPQPVRATLPPPPPRLLAPETSTPSKPAPPPETISRHDKVSPHQTAPQPDPAPPPEPAQLQMLPLKAAVLPPSVDDRPQTRRLRRLRSASPCCLGACACPTFGR